MIRGMAVGVMHIVSILALAFVICLSRRFKVLSLSAVLGALSFSVIFHGLYNLLVSEPGMSSFIGYVMPLLTAIIMFNVLPYERLEYTGVIGFALLVAGETLA